nr:hypothetical protein Q903MT_gene3013 [Picea sitchensis]
MSLPPAVVIVYVVLSTMEDRVNLLLVVGGLLISSVLA